MLCSFLQALQLGLPVSVELCVKALQLPSQEDNDTRTAVCKTVACLLSEDLEVLRACQLTEFLLRPSQDSFTSLEELYQQPDQKYDEENGIIPNSLRCELLLALKAIWPFDPEFWDWKTLKHHCNRLLGLQPEMEEEEARQEADLTLAATDFNEKEKKEGDQDGKMEIKKLEREAVKNSEAGISSIGHEDDDQNKDGVKTKEDLRSPSKRLAMTERSLRWQKYKFCCLICKKEVIEARFLHHSKKHEENGVFTCPVCLKKFQGKNEFSPHISTHSQMPARGRNPQKRKKVKKKVDLEKEMEEDEAEDLEPGEITLDPSIRMYYESTHDPDVLHHIMEQAAAVPRKQADQDYITFDYISTHFAFQDSELYTCPATNCSKNFKLFKYLSVHLKEHGDGDPNIKHYLEMKDKREKCSFCRKHFMTAYHHRKHRRVHFGDQPYMCIVTGCGARFNAINKLVEHKHSHGFQLSYQCELKGCSISFSDLGQLYHHEAQHFRNAAYHCTSPGCKKFYYSRKEFLKHLNTHSITFTEDDFEKQRDRLRKVGGDVLEEESIPKCNLNALSPEVISGLQKDTSSPLACSSSPCQTVDYKDLKGSLTNVAVCFDGKKFTCGFEKCRKTFSKTRDIQRHLKCVHSDQVKMEKETTKKGHKKVDKDRGLKIDIKTDTADQDARSPHSPQPSHEKGIASTPKHTEPVTPAPKDSLAEILVSLSQLSLHCPFPRRSSCDPVHPVSGIQVAPLSSAPGKSPSKSNPEKSESKQIPPAETKKQQLKNMSNDAIPAESRPQTCQASSFLIQPTTKPYTCDMKDCSYESVTSHALKRHYQTKHNISDEEVKGFEKFKAEFKFKPFKCHLCPKGYREKKELRTHYMQTHKISEAVVDQMSCSPKKKEESKVQDLPKPKAGLKQNKETNEEKATDVPVWRPRLQRRKELPLTKIERENDLAAEEKNSNLQDVPALQGDHGEDGVTKEGRGSRRLVAKNNLCYILTNYHKPYHCVHKDCNSAFTNQSGLVRHLQTVHHYNRSQLSLEGEQNITESVSVKKELSRPHLFFCKYNGCGKHFHHSTSLCRHNRRVHRKMPSRVLHPSRPLSTLQNRREPVSEEPIPRFKCSYANCNASYHLNSSLLRHTNNEHRNQNSLNQTAQKSPSSLVHCKFEGCNRVFTQSSNYRRHVFYRHYEYYDTVVLHLQNANKKDESASGCQKKLITPSPKLPLRHSLRFNPKPQEPIQSEESTEENVEESINENELKEEKSTAQSSHRRQPLVFRTHEEALQMCQDRCLPVAYPCMVQDCNSVVTVLSSMRRHYMRIHKMSDNQFNLQKDKLVFTSEQLEEIIQKKSALALPEIVRSPGGVLKMEYQAEPDNPGGPPLPMSLHSIKTTQMEERDIVVLSEKPPSDSSILDSDNLLYGETPGHTEALPEVQSSHSQEVSQPQSPSPPPVQATLIDLSPPPTLRISVDEGFESSGNDGGKSVPATPAPSVTVPVTPPRQPLKRKNETLSETPQPLSPSPNSRELSTVSPVPNPFDLAAYKPIGFESSFLKFIQESREKEDIVPVKPEPSKRRESHRRNCSVKENSQRGLRITRSRLGRASPLKPLLSASDFLSVENLHYILDRALTGCGDDQAIKQLQYLRPVVVLERSKLS